MNARRLMRFDSVAQILRWAEDLVVETIMPVAIFQGDRVTLTIPESVSLGITDWSFPNLLKNK